MVIYVIGKELAMLYGPWADSMYHMQGISRRQFL